jgi:putative endonuclease
MNRLLGRRGEDEAARFLRNSGMKVLVRGYRSHFGEIDLIARDGDTLVFVEVKARREGVPAEAVTPEKQRRLTLTALHFLKANKLLDQQCRFDVVAIVWPVGQSKPRIEHIRNAFDAVGSGQMYR